MATIASLWWLWLAIMIVSGGYATLNQVRRMRNMHRNVVKFDFTAGLGPMVFAAFIMSISGLMLLIAVAVQLITMAR